MCALGTADYVQDQQISALEMLPCAVIRRNFHKKNDLHNGLRLWRAVLELIYRSAQSLSTGNLLNFDGLVGNNSCHVTSFVNLDVALEFKRGGSLSRQCADLLVILPKFLEKLDILLAENDSREIPDRFTGTFSEFLDSFELGLQLDRRLLFLAMMYGLTVCREIGNDNVHRSRPACLVSLFPYLSKKSATKLIKFWQRESAQIAIDWMIRSSSSLTEIQQAWCRYLQSDYLISDDDGRLCAPSFASTGLLFSLLLHKSDAILAIQTNIVEPDGIVDSFRVQYEIADGQLHQIRNPEHPKYSTRLVWVWEGCTITSVNTSDCINAVRYKMQKLEPLSLVLGHSAQYPEYPSSLGQQAHHVYDSVALSELTPMNYDSLRQVIGVSREDPQLWCATHIYLDTNRGALCPTNFITGLACKSPAQVA